MNGNGQPDRVAIIANPSSGAGKNRARVDRLAAALRTHGLVAECSWDPAEEVRGFADPERRASYRCVVAAGGDGTVNRVLNSGPIPPLVVFPLGTENLFAKRYDYPRDPARLATRIALGSVRTIDLARMEERVFALVVSAGFDAEVIHRMDRWRRDGHAVKRIRHLSYARPILAALREYRHPTVQLEADGQRSEGTLAMVLNLPIYVRRLVPVPGGREDDGLLDWLVARPRSLAGLLGLARDLYLGRHLRRRDVRWGRARHVQITSAEPVPVQLDGETAGTTPADIHVQPAALQIIV